MSTRCQLGFYKQDEKDLNKFQYALLYRHWDGYPESVIPDILPFLRAFDKERGLDDVSYAIARLAQHLCNIHDEETKTNNLRHSNYLGHGIDNIFHLDTEFFYAIYPDRVEVWEVGGSWDKTEFEKWKLIETHFIKED